MIAAAYPSSPRRSAGAASIGCHGAIPSAPTTISDRAARTVERSTSTTASRCRRDRGDRAQPARGRADGLLQCARRVTRCCCPIFRAEPSCGGHFSAGSSCSSTPAHRSPRMFATRCRRSPSRRGASASSSMSTLGSTETAPSRLQRHRQARRHIGIAGRRRAEARPSEGKLEAGSRVHYHARLLAPAGAHRRRLRRGRLLQDRRRAELRRSGRSGKGLPLRRTHRRGLQARDRHLGQRRAVARGGHRACAPLVRDVVIAGHDRDDVAALLVPDLDACRKLAADLPADAPAATVLQSRASCRDRAAARGARCRTAARPPASAAPSCSPSRPRSTSARPPTRDRSTSARCSPAAPP